MKKSNSNDNHQDGQEQSKKLYRSISESARRLDDAHSCAHHVGDLFSPTLQIQRSRFQEYCERLIFYDPTLFGRKAEELLWRKCYYDVISAAKRLKKKEYTSNDISNIETHINAGVGHYHHFILRLQYQFQMDVKNVIDFAIFKNSWKKSSTYTSKLEQLEWAQQSVHRCLIYLGDLNRYKLEIYPKWDPGLSIRCYLKAIQFKPEYGIPHNQMGTLASNQNRVLDAVYHYICCLSCKTIFDGTENNLLRLFEKNAHTLEEFPSKNRNADCIVQLEPADHIRRLVARFLFLVEMWYFNKNFADVYILCHETNVDLQECLLYSKPVSNHSDDIPTDVDSIETDSISSPTYLSDDMVFKLVVICLLCISKVQKLYNNQISTVVAFTLAVYSQLIQIVTDHIRESLIPCIPEDVELKRNLNGLSKGRNFKGSKWKSNVRRRRKKKLSSDESDMSELDDETKSNSEPSIDGSDHELISSSENDTEDDDDMSTNHDKSTETEEDKNATNVAHQLGSNQALDFNKSATELARKVREIDPNILLDIVSEEKLLLSIKILSDWFIGDTEIVKSCGKSTRSLLKQIVQLLNFLNIDFNNEKLTDYKHLIEQQKDEQLLSEELALRGVNIQNNFVGSQSHNKQLSGKEETIIRMSRLVLIGHSLVEIEETGISFNDDLQQFTIQELEMEEVNGIDIYPGDTGDTDTEKTLMGMKIPTTDNNDTSNQMTKMKHMGQLWLAAEVRALENRVRSKTSLSPYLVLDVDSLIQSTAIVKHLVNSKKFIVVIPSAVVSALDDLKRVKPEARDAIRWLELQFHHGNRFCRAQRPQERSSLPFIKYPKKKDKELFTYIQIIECCHYFVQQQNLSNLVTLLTGRNAVTNSENRDISYTGLAHSAGINVEIVTNFYDKWRKNLKGNK